MKEMEMLLKTVSDGLRILAQGAKVIADKLETFAEQNKGDSAQSAGRRVPIREEPVKPRAARAPRKTEGGAGPRRKKAASTAERVYKAMSRMEGSASIDGVAKKTGYDKKQIHNALFKLKKQGKVESVSKGVYRTVA